MLKPNLKNILLFIFVKHILFYIFMMFKNNDYTLISIFEYKTFQDWFMYLFIFLWMPFVYCFLFIIALHYALNPKRLFITLPIILSIFVVEYTVYTFLNSPANYLNGIYNALIGAIVLLLFFYKSVRSKAKTYLTNS